MNVVQQSIAKTLLPAYRVQNVEFRRIERFKTELARLLEHLSVPIPDMSETETQQLIALATRILAAKRAARPSRRRWTHWCTACTA